MTGNGVSRRTLLRGLAGGVTGPWLLRAAPPVTVLPMAAAGCAAGRDIVQIVVVWSGRELEVFRRVLDGFPDLPPIQLISAGNGIESLLRSRVAAGNPPHIAVVSQPGQLKGLGNHLVQFRASDGLPENWQKFVQIDRTQYGVLLKATHKSVFWHQLSDPFLSGYQPGTLGDLCDVLELAAGQGHEPLGIGAADGWVLTDWFENALLGTYPAVYRALAKGEGSWSSEQVRSVLRRLGEIWQIKGLLAGGPRRALLTQYDQAALQVLRRSHCGAGVTFEGDFVAAALAPYQRAGLVAGRLGMFRFPPNKPGGERPLVVGGDIAVRLRTIDKGDRAGEVLQCLAGKDAAQMFANHGFLTVHTGVKDAGEYLKAVPGLPSDSKLPYLLGKLAEQLRQASQIDFDLSDRLTGGLAGGDGQGLWRLLQDFFGEVTRRPGTDLDQVVSTTQERIAGAAAHGWA